MNDNIHASGDDIVYIGKTNFREGGKIFGVHNKDRFQHMYIIGQTGTGKTTLLKNLAIQDIEAGRGIAVVDPHGEFVDELLQTIPPERMNDVIYFNPIDTAHPMGFNVLQVRDPEHKHLVSSGLMAIFTKIWANVWSARMEYILNNCILALIDTPGTTLLGIPRMLVDKQYRQIIVNNCKDPVVRSFWINEFEQYEQRYRSEAIAPIQNKVGQFLSTHLIRNIVGQSKSTLDIDHAMNSGKILLINVSKGRIGEDNSALLGAMLITKIQLAAMERVRFAPEKRRDFFLYVDEFQNFATDSFASILSEARKYGLGLIISHQYVGQLVTANGDKLRDAIFGNVGTTITFRIGSQDAEMLAMHYAPEIVAEDLINLPNHSIYMKLLVQGVSTRPFSATTLPPIKIECTPDQLDKIIANSRANYARDRQDVEDEILQWSGMRGGAPQAVSVPQIKPNTPNKNNIESVNQETIIKPRPVIIQPKYDVDLKSVGIDIGETKTIYKEVPMQLPEPVSLSELSNQSSNTPRKKRKRKRKGGSGYGGSSGGNDLRNTLNSVLGFDNNMYPTIERPPQNNDDNNQN